jgi:hypothetical protein
MYQGHLRDTIEQQEQQVSEIHVDFYISCSGSMAQHKWSSFISIFCEQYRHQQRV